MKKILFLFLWLPVFILSAQNNNIDSLKTALGSVQSAKDSTNILVNLCWEYRFINAAIAREYGLKALELAQKNSFREYEV